jgi:hypothetical protein
MFHTTTTHFSPTLPSLPTYPRFNRKRAYAPPTPEASDNDSEYSDREYRSSLVIGRKRGRCDDSDDDSDIVRERRGGGKRRIIDVMGGVLRGAWKMISTPFVAMPAPPVVVERVLPGGWESHTQAPRGWDAPTPRTWDPQPLRTWEPTPPSSAGSTACYEDSSSSAQQWIMVSPRTTPSPTTVTRSTRSFSNASSRGRRPLKKRGLIGVVGSTNSPKKHRKTFSLSRDAEEADEYMDDDMRRFNERLKMMIREGREALGAKVEVVYDEDEDMEMGF